MNKSYIVRKITETDFSAIIKIANLSFPRSKHDLNYLFDIYIDNPFNYVAINDTEEIVGYILCLWDHIIDMDEKHIT